MNKFLTSILAYITIIGWVVAFFLGDREGAKQHLNQALVLGICEIAFGVIFKILAFVPFMGFISWILGIVLSICWLWGLVTAVLGIDMPIPVIGSIKIL